MRASRICAVAVLTMAAGALAQPARHESPKHVRADGKLAQVVLAAADTVRAPAPAPAAVPGKRPAPRITHCRCGDPGFAPADPSE